MTNVTLRHLRTAIYRYGDYHNGFLPIPQGRMEAMVCHVCEEITYRAVVVGGWRIPGTPGNLPSHFGETIIGCEFCYDEALDLPRLPKRKIDL